MAKLPDDVVAFLHTAEGEQAKDLRAQYGIDEPVVKGKIHFLWTLSYSTAEQAWMLAEAIAAQAGVAGDKIITELSERHGVKTAFDQLILKCVYDADNDKLEIVEIA